VARRDTYEKVSVSLDGVASYVDDLLGEIQNNLFQKAVKYREDHTTEVTNMADFTEVLDTKGGFVVAHWDGTSETELKIKDETKATIRCIPLDAQKEDGKCVYSGKPSSQKVIFARSY